MLLIRLHRTANDDTLLYGVEVKFYNMEVEVDENLECKHKGLYIIGDGSGVTQVPLSMHLPAGYMLQERFLKRSINYGYGYGNVA